METAVAGGDLQFGAMCGKVKNGDERRAERDNAWPRGAGGRGRAIGCKTEIRGKDGKNPPTLRRREPPGEAVGELVAACYGRRATWARG